MSENGGSNGSERVTVPLEALVDRIEITFDRRDGSMKIGGKMCNLDVALDMCHRAARYFEQQVRLAAVAAARDQIAEQQRVAALLDRTRGGRG